MPQTFTPMSSLPPDAQALMAAIGPVWGSNVPKHGDLVKEVYAPLHRAAPQDGVAVMLDLPYGTHARQVVDLYRPRAPNGDVVLFVHGGAFVRGDKTINDTMYANVLTWFARQGVLGINVEYRLAPEAVYPGGAEDVGAAVAWAARHCAQHGGNPQRLFLIGHSAGGTHAAAYAYDPAVGALGRHLAGLVLVSARVRADLLPENPNAGPTKIYFGDDPARYEQRSPVNHAAYSDLPVMIVNAEFENPLLDIYGLELAHRIAQARRRAPRYLRLTRHNHVSIMAHFNTDEEYLGREMLDFFATLR